MTDPQSDRSQVQRKPGRGAYDRATIDAILDEALICHVGFQDTGQPFVIPTLHVRVGDAVYLHGSPASRMLRAIEAGAQTCIAATIVDGLVLARSAMHHSMNYRSAVVFGRGRGVDDPDEKMEVLTALTERILAGRWSETRGPSERELSATKVVVVPIEEASAKIRSGPPIDDEEDHALGYWAGVVPLSIVSGSPIPDPRLRPGIGLPQSLTPNSGVVQFPAGNSHSRQGRP